MADGAWVWVVGGCLALAAFGYLALTALELVHASGLAAIEEAKSRLRRRRAERLAVLGYPVPPPEQAARLSPRELARAIRQSLKSAPTQAPKA